MKVHYRNNKAKEEFESNMAHYETLRGAAKRDATKPTRMGLTSEDLDASTVGDLKIAVEAKLYGSPQQSPTYFDRQQNLWIFECAESGQPLRRLRRDVPEDTLLTSGVEYCVHEVYDGLSPFPVHRTVGSMQTQPATYCLPSKRGLTNVSPLCTASFTTSEYQEYWASTDDKGEFKVHGLSVFSQTPDMDFQQNNNMVPTGELANPFDHVNPPGVYELSLDDYVQYLNDDDLSQDWGVLRSGISHQLHPGGLWQGRGPVQAPESQVYNRPPPGPRERKEKFVRQSAFFSFELDGSTDLRKHGLALVVDNLGPFEDHCTLVLASGFGSLINVPRFDDRIVRTPRPLGQMSNDELQAFLSPDDTKQQPQVYGIYPEPIQCVAGSFAPEFRLHSLKVKANAEPGPLEKFDGEEAEEMYHAAQVLFSVLPGDPHDEFVYSAIEALQAADYQVGGVHCSVRDTLFDAMNLVDVGLLSPENKEKLEDGIQILHYHDRC